MKRHEKRTRKHHDFRPDIVKAHDSLREEFVKAHNFWKHVLSGLIVLVGSFVLKLVADSFLLTHTLSSQFEWMKKANASKTVTQGHRTMFDIGYASLHPRMHSVFVSLGFYTTCSQSAADFALMTVSFFKDRLKLEHWAGCKEGASFLTSFLPNRSDKVSQDNQWDAWSKSAKAQTFKQSDGTSFDVPVNVWYDLFPKDKDSFFEVPLINECATAADHGDSMVTKLGMLYSFGLSGSLKFISHGQSAASLFQFYWMQTDPPKPSSCSGQVKNALVNGAMMGVNGGFAADGAIPTKDTLGMVSDSKSLSMMAEGKELMTFSKSAKMAMLIGVVAASATAVAVTSYFGTKEQCKADKNQRTKDVRHDD
jgi:hypothetical protein